MIPLYADDTQKCDSKNGFHVIGEAADGEEAVSKYKELQPDLVTMDITMPKMDGITAIKEIIKYDANAKS